MTAFRPRLWTSLSAAAVLLAACGGEGEPGAAAGEAGEAGTAPVASVGGEGEGGGGEGETAAIGEAGARDAYANVPEGSRAALRLGQIKGFILAAQAAAPAQGPEAASALVGQGLLEVFDPARAGLRASGVDEAALRRAAETGAPADLTAAIAALDAATTRAGGEPAAVVRGLTEIASGLYGEVAKDGGIDPMEYQHSYGAALAARDVARRAGLTALAPELDRLVALWPAPVAPDDAARLTPVGRVLAQASRVELAASS